MRFSIRMHSDFRWIRTVLAHEIFFYLNFGIGIDGCSFEANWWLTTLWDFQLNQSACAMIEDIFVLFLKYSTIIFAPWTSLNCSFYLIISNDDDDVQIIEPYLINCFFFSFSISFCIFFCVANNKQLKQKIWQISKSH